MRIWKNRLLCLLLALMLPVSAVRPLSVFAEDTVPAAEATAVTESPPEEASQEPDASPPEFPDPPEEAEIPPSEEALTQEAPTEAEPTEAAPERESPQLLASLPDAASGPGLYFGQLHSHTARSGGTGKPEEAFSHAANVAGLDFFALTEHGHTLDADAWAEGQAAAAAATTGSFLALYGYEMSWPRMKQLGHITAFGTDTFHSWNQAEFQSENTGLQTYYDRLSGIPGAIGQFCHPGTGYGDFTDFTYRPAADSTMVLLEVFSGEGSSTVCAVDSYIRALDQGWHVAPTAGQANYQGSWGDANSLRTVVYAQSLTEADIYAALRSRRVYATEDSDLEITCTLDGQPMGSILKKRQVGEQVSLCLTLQDPTDGNAAQAEVITENGQCLASHSFQGSLCLSLPSDCDYYFLKITQPDGDMAITAAVWIDQQESLGISGIVCETAVPEQGQATNLRLELFNRENVPFQVDLIEIFADGQLLREDASPLSIPAGSTLSHSLSVTCGSIGLTRFTLRISGTLEKARRSYETSIDLCLRRSDQVTDILVDGTHENAGLDSLSRLTVLASQEDIRVSVVQDTLSPEVLKTARFLLITPPETGFSREFLSTVSEFAAYGGSLVICGRSAGQNTSLSELNRLLAELGCSMELLEDCVTDPVNNGGSPYLLLTSRMNPDSLWWDGLSSNQVFRYENGCSISAGSGTWLVRGGKTADHVLLACEQLSGGGYLFLSGASLWDDDALAESENIWDEPYANHYLLGKVMGIGGDPLPLSTIRQARTAEEGSLLRIRGYVTAGTSNPRIGFGTTLYLQDDTGGIAVAPFLTTGISIGTPLEITGTVRWEDGNPILHYSSHKVLDAWAYRYTAETGDWKTLLDPVCHGGRLVQVEGTCSAVNYRTDGTLASCVLTDREGSTALVLVEDGIGSGTEDTNTLHKTVRRGRTVRAIGILHTGSDGEAAIRVRNCAEVVVIPAKAASNPATGDPLPLFGWESASLFFLPVCVAWLSLRKKASDRRNLRY